MSSKRTASAPAAQGARAPQAEEQEPPPPHRPPPGPPGHGRHELPGRAEPAERFDIEEEEEEYEGEELDDEEDEEESESVTVEISGLSLYTRHGTSEAEREVGQRLVIDLRLDLGRCAATATDELEDTVDYAEVCQLVALIAQQRSYRTLERLCARIAERLLDDYEIEGVWVKAMKPEPPITLPVDGVSVELWRESI